MMRARFFAHPITRIVVGIAIVMAATLITMAVVDSLVPNSLRVACPVPLATLTGVLGYRFFFSRVEKRAITELALPGAAHEAATGIAVGAVLGLLVAGVLAIVGSFFVSGSNGWSVMFKSLPEQVMVACFEELLFRGVLFRIVGQRWGTRTSLIVSFVAFALAHLPNGHVSLLAILVTGVAGVTFSACYMLTRRLWLSMGVHLGWNYLYDGLFAVPVSGHAARGWLQVAMPGPDWLTGGSYGVEASVMTLLVWGAAAILLLRRVPK